MVKPKPAPEASAQAAVRGLSPIMQSCTLARDQSTNLWMLIRPIVPRVDGGQGDMCFLLPIEVTEVLDKAFAMWTIAMNAQTSAIISAGLRDVAQHHSGMETKQ